MIFVPLILLFFFFFSSRRRHTRSLCDWSSDVCSSDLWETLTAKLGALPPPFFAPPQSLIDVVDRKSTRLNSSHTVISYAVFCLRSEEHTSELQSHSDLVCRLLLEIGRAHV